MFVRSVPSYMKVSRLSVDDVLLARELNALFGKEFGDAETYGAERPSDGYLQKLLGKDDVIALVALADNRVIGGLVAYELAKLERHRSEIYIYDLAVDAAHRRRGVATGLIEALRKAAKERGAWAMFVQADHGDKAAIALYGGLGTREDVLHFDISVSSA